MFTSTSFPPMHNGLQLHVCPDKSFPIVSTALILDIGSKDEMPEQQGWAHLCEHLLFTGTKQVPDFDDALSKYGGTSNAWTSCDATVFLCSGPKNILERILFLESERLQNMSHSLQKSAFKSELNVVISEYNEQVRDVPFGEFIESQETLFYGADHPYGHSVIGTPKILRRSKYKDIQNFLQIYKNLDNAHLIVVGDVIEEQVWEWTQNYFAPFPESQQKRNTIVPNITQNSNLYIEKGQQIQSLLRLDWMLPQNTSQQCRMFEAIADWLDSEQGPLYQDLAFSKGWSNEIICEIDKKRYSHSFSISVYFSSEQSYENIKEVVLDNLRKLHHIPLRKCEKQIQRNILNQFENFDSRCEYLATGIEIGISIETILHDIIHIELLEDVFENCITYLNQTIPMTMIGQGRL